MRSEANNNALSKLSYMAINTINQICVIVYTCDGVTYYPWYNLFTAIIITNGHALP